MHVGRIAHAGNSRMRRVYPDRGHKVTMYSVRTLCSAFMHEEHLQLFPTNKSIESRTCKKSTETGARKLDSDGEM